MLRLQAHLAPPRAADPTGPWIPSLHMQSTRYVFVRLQCRDGERDMPCCPVDALWYTGRCSSMRAAPDGHGTDANALFRSAREEFWPPCRRTFLLDPRAAPLRAAPWGAGQVRGRVRSAAAKR